MTNQIIVQNLGDVYVIKNPNHSYNIIINNDVTVPFSETIQTKTMPKIIQSITKKNTKTGYKNTNGGICTVEAYEHAVGLLTSKGKRDSYDGWFFRNIDDRHAYEKFTNQWTTIYTETIDLVDIPFVIIDITGRKDNPYIRCVRVAGNQKDMFKDNELLYTYTPKLAHLVRSVALEKGFTEIGDTYSLNREHTRGMMYSISRHASDNEISHMTINSNYYSNDIKTYGMRVGTWDECESTYRSHKSEIGRRFDKEIEMMRLEGMIVVDIPKVIKSLEIIIGHVNNMSVKVKSKVKPHQIKNKIDALILDIKKTALNEEE